VRVGKQDGAVVSSKLTRSVSRPDWNITLPLFQFTPIEGSSALRPTCEPLTTGGV